MKPACVPLRIEKGATFRDALRIMQPILVYRPITQIAPTAPVRLTIPGHGLPGTWLAWADGVQGMPELNRARLRQLPHRVASIDDDTIEINLLSAVGLAPVGGQLIYQPPVDLAGAEVRMQIREAPGGTVLMTLALGSGLDLAGAGTISREISASATSELMWSSAVYDLDVTYPDGTVHRYYSGPISVSHGGGCDG
ncbi:hypothetical protein R5H17_010390 [Pseudomonas aeruginosa]|jgi:hypothetical protein|uniref:hypothetical protein n=1 Tax=Pseudomonas aeruginosa TaxID=287 RepID=UPI0003BB28E8|nr:hypothetical protein [Pseudomonas aeruginosa]ERY95205.1 hypothetical protein Q023_01196 [Pseudomonas aeruginosa BWHPSA010]KAA5631336.1 hypothetical protein F3H11_05980 [Pseudomonas aeruginosa]KAA5645145.1 hypothetical protein F3G63_12955 [Pseudomonas aeruginosa]KRV40991.1 hypothetical protein AN461_01415 [Pseudomonas aeruginosa]MBH3553277.1 hypothetical protein [Pseudomonas aeruginosa]